MAQRKPAEAWQELLARQVREAGRRCFHLAWRIVRDPHAAEDICQQAFLKAWESREHVRDPLALTGWLLKVVTNESLLVLRRRKGELQHRAEVAKDEATLTTTERTDFHDALRVALAELPEVTQIVVVLRLMEGLSGNEVSRLLGCSASEVSRRLHEGMDHLRARLSRELYA